jgi:hypothetical protein
MQLDCGHRNGDKWPDSRRSGHWRQWNVHHRWHLHVDPDQAAYWSFTPTIAVSRCRVLVFATCAYDQKTIGKTVDVQGVNHDQGRSGLAPGAVGDRDLSRRAAHLASRLEGQSLKVAYFETLSPV